MRLQGARCTSSLSKSCLPSNIGVSALCHTTASNSHLLIRAIGICQEAVPQGKGIYTSLYSGLPYCNCNPPCPQTATARSKSILMVCSLLAGSKQSKSRAITEAKAAPAATTPPGLHSVPTISYRQNCRYHFILLGSFQLATCPDLASHYVLISRASQCAPAVHLLHQCTSTFNMPTLAKWGWARPPLTQSHQPG